MYIYIYTEMIYMVNISLREEFNNHGSYYHDDFHDKKPSVQHGVVNHH